MLREISSPPTRESEYFSIGLRAGFALNPAQRWRADCSGLRAVARKSVLRAQGEPRWVGSADLGFLLGGNDQIFDISPVASPDGVVGLILSSGGSSGGERIGTESGTPVPPGVPSRIVGIRDGCTMLLTPSNPICGGPPSRCLAGHRSGPHACGNPRAGQRGARAVPVWFHANP